MSTPEPAGLPSSSRSDEDHLTDRYPAGQFLTTRETDVDPGPGAPLPREFGNYTLLEEIGAGGMGVVYKARQKSPDRLVALKMIRAGQLASAEDVRRFREEADRAAGLDHPHIVPVFDFGEVAGQHFFSMKLIGGGSLARHLVRYRDDPKEAARAADLTTAEELLSVESLDADGIRAVIAAHAAA